MHIDFSGYQARLDSEMQENLAAIAQAGQAAGTVELDQSSVGRLSRMDALQQQALAKDLLERRKLRQRQLEAALMRVAAGSYGRCCECQEELEPKRLNADPAVVFCAACAAARE
jgi:DnaK suppressor protein